MVRENANTTLRRENEDLKSELSKVNKIPTNTMERAREMENEYRKVLHKDGSEREIHLKQEILALETCVRFWPVQTTGRSGQYSTYFNGPDSESGSTLSATASSVLRELRKETLDGLTMEKA